MDKIVDFTNTPDGFRDYGGTDSKNSKIYNGEHYMIKFADQKIKKLEIDTSESNSIFSEYISSHISKSMGMPTHDTLLGFYKDEPIVACKDFVPEGKRLQEFDWFMRTVYRKGEIGRIPTYEQIYGTIENSRLNIISEAAIARYWDTFIIDSFVGNFDRHKGNWGFLTDEKTGEISLAPVYDFGSSLYPGLAERGFKQILSSESEIMARMYDFPKAALNRNTDAFKINKFGYFEMLSSNFDPYCTAALIRMAPKINMTEVHRIVDETPIISDARKEFYKAMLSHRKELIIDKALEVVLDINRENDDLFKPFSERVPEAYRDATTPSGGKHIPAFAVGVNNNVPTIDD